MNQNTEELAAQAARIAALETWQAETNTNIQALQTLLSTTDYITAVTPIVQDGVEVGFTISFLNTPAITIYHGTKGDTGDTPQIGAAQGDDGNWYWTLNGEFLTDADNNLILANALLPQLATGTKLTAQDITTDSQGDAIYLSVDGGKTWTRVSGEKGDTGDTGATGPQGDSFFESVDTTNADYVTFILTNNGGSFTVPRYVGISLTLEGNHYLVYGESVTITCQTNSNSSYTKDNLYVLSAPDGWEVVINDDLTLTVTAPDGNSEGEILVMLDNKKGNTTIERIPVESVEKIVYGTTLKASKLNAGELKEMINDHSDLTTIIVMNGTLNDNDWVAIRSNMWTLQTLDLASVTCNFIVYDEITYVGTLYADPVPLKTAKLPQGITAIDVQSFVYCTSLTSIELPASLERIYYNAFYLCYSLTTVTCLATNPPELQTGAFASCNALTEIRVSSTSVEAYKQAAGWSAYADIIVAIN